MATVQLRDLMNEDRPYLFEIQTDPEANHMAAFTSKDPTDDSAHQEWWGRVMKNEGIIKRAILCDGDLVGSVLSFMMGENLEVSYWIDKKHWGRGIATDALGQLLEIVNTRPIYAHAATDNKGSIRVLEKCGFTICDTEKGFANARGEEIEEYVLRKD